ncbi:MAG: peptide/nickel transport system permease protein, partial [Chloroflexota bacterium]|nr:peptide/nickel transport system permease protein [Chloroflexota bacterium]
RPSSRRFIEVRRLLGDPAGLTGAILVVLALVAAVLAPVLSPHAPDAMNQQSQLKGPSLTFLLGTDELGRDLLSRMLWGARVSLQVAVIAVTVSGIIGVAIGLAAGFFRGPLDGLLMRVMDIIFAFPAILLALTMMAVLGSELRNLILAIAIVYIPSFARVARASTLVVGSELYVEAARSVGAGNLRLMLRHIVPNITAPLVVQFTVGFAYAILIEAALSFLGLGVQPPTPSWGNMLFTGKTYMEISPWLVLAPGTAIMLTVLGFNLLGDGLRDALDPRLRMRGM